MENCYVPELGNFHDTGARTCNEGRIFSRRYVGNNGIPTSAYHSYILCYITYLAYTQVT